MRGAYIYTNEDCMEGMKRFTDKHFELAIVDVNYGISANHNMGRRKGDRSSPYKKITWDDDSPPVEYFNELFRVSKNQIIWGANHFISKIAIDSSCWLLWDKGFSSEVTFAQFELAWTSFDSTCKKFDFNAANNKDRIHPTQKPVALFKWLLKNYAKEGDNILDTHVGSASSIIAAVEYGFDITGFELDRDYFEASNKRIRQHFSQLSFV